MSESNLEHRIDVITDDFDQHQVYSELVANCAGQVGAIVTFVGLVRDQSGSPDAARQVETLTLEHYPGMTERSIEGIVDKARGRWPLLGSHVIHRVGQLQATDQIVLVAVASAHRDAAFAAAEFIMDYLKTDAIFWKQEKGEEGERWIESTSDDHRRQQQWSK